MTSWHNLSVEQVFLQLDSCSDGLTEIQAVDRFKRWGSNQLQMRKPTPAYKLFFKQFANYFILVLLFAAGLAYAVSYLPGEADRKLTAYYILVIILVSVFLGFFEEYRSQRELEAVSKLLLFNTMVLREGVRKEIDAVLVVPGDFLVLSPGQKVPADARLIEAHSLRADESTLTGESLGVDKAVAPLPIETPLSERSCIVFASTFITRSTGLALVVNTGSASQVGQIASALEEMSERPTPFQTEVSKMARQMTWVIGFLVVLVALIMLFVMHAFTRVMVVSQLDDLSIWSNPALLISYAAAVGLQC
jgi:P-type Ca2+ transporter type 2C